MIFYCIDNRLFLWEKDYKPIDNSIIFDIMTMGKPNKILKKMEACPKNVRFSGLCKVCDRHFGRARQQGTSHRVYKTPWADDPRINIQEEKGMAKAYQVKQLLAAVKRLEDENEPEK